MIKVFLPILFLMTTGCGIRFLGTNTGNPPGIDSSSPAVPYEGALKLGSSICSKISSCYPASAFNTCLQSVVNISGYTSEMGVTASTYPTLTDLRNAELALQVTANTTNFDSCIQAIEALSCADSNVQNAYSIATPNAYTATNLLFRSSGSCTQIY